jgi:hypothetical protein
VADAIGSSLAEILALPPAPLACDLRLHASSEAAGRRLSEFLAVPLVSGEVAGGNARVVDESVLGWLFLPREEFGRREGNLIAVRIVGRSMEPELPDGCIKVEFWRLMRGESLEDRLIGRVVWAGFSFLEAGQAAERQPPYGGGAGPEPRTPRRRGEEEPF